MVWEIEKKLADDGVRPIIFYDRCATYWQPPASDVGLIGIRARPNILPLGIGHDVGPLARASIRFAYHLNAESRFKLPDMPRRTSVSLP